MSVEFVVALMVKAVGGVVPPTMPASVVFNAVSVNVKAPLIVELKDSGLEVPAEIVVFAPKDTGPLKVMMPLAVTVPSGLKVAKDVDKRLVPEETVKLPEATE